MLIKKKKMYFLSWTDIRFLHANHIAGTSCIHLLRFGSHSVHNTPALVHCHDLNLLSSVLDRNSVEIYVFLYSRPFIILCMCNPFDCVLGYIFYFSFFFFYRHNNKDISNENCSNTPPPPPPRPDLANDSAVLEFTRYSRIISAINLSPCLLNKRYFIVARHAT